MSSDKMISIKMDGDLHMLMKRECVTENLTIAKFIEKAVAEKLHAEYDQKDDKWTISSATK